MIIGVLEIRKNDEESASSISIALKNDIQSIEAVLESDNKGETFYSKELIITSKEKDYTIEIDRATSFVVHDNIQPSQETGDVNVVRGVIADLLLTAEGVG